MSRGTAKQTNLELRQKNLNGQKPGALLRGKISYSRGLFQVRNLQVDANSKSFHNPALPFHEKGSDESDLNLEKKNTKHRFLRF
jgi:hypothetical protein